MWMKRVGFMLCSLVLWYYKVCYSPLDLKKQRKVPMDRYNYRRHSRPKPLVVQLDQDVKCDILVSRAQSHRDAIQMKRRDNSSCYPLLLVIMTSFQAVSINTVLLV
jgi:hypothetical protein